MRNIYLFILILLTVELFAQKNDTLTLWSEVKGYSYDTDPFFNNYSGIDEIASVSMVRIPDQNVKNLLHFSCLKLKLSTFPKEVGDQQYFLREINIFDSETWDGKAVLNSYILYLSLSQNSEFAILGGLLSFNVKNARYEIRHKEGELYYIIQVLDSAIDAPDKLLNTYPPIDIKPEKEESIDTTSK